MKFFAQVATCISFSFITLTAEVPDTQIFRLLPGEWQVNQNIEGVKIIGKSTYSTNGTATYEGTFYFEDNEYPFRVVTKWNVDHGKLINTVTETSNADFITVGTEEIDSVLEINDSTFRYLDSDGTPFVETRKIPDSHKM